MTRQNLRTLAAVFGYAFLLCIAIQLIALGMMVGMRDTAFNVHEFLFNVSLEEFELVAFQMLILMKTLGLVFFLLPWAALRIVASRMPD